jgi:hypothetical protein
VSAATPVHGPPEIAELKIRPLGFFRFSPGRLPARPDSEIELAREKRSEVTESSVAADRRRRDEQ